MAEIFLSSNKVLIVLVTHQHTPNVPFLHISIKNMVRGCVPIQCGSSCSFKSSVSWWSILKNCKCRSGH